MSKFYFVGIDVSKDKLDICFLGEKSDSKPKFETLPNKENIIKAYFESFKSDKLVVCFEYTNNYHILLQKALTSLKIKYNVLNPAKTSFYLRHLSHIKNDIKDALGLAIYAKNFSIDLFPDKFSKEYNLLKSYSSTLLLLTKISTQIKNFKASQKFVCDEAINLNISILQKTIENIKKKLRDINYRILKSLVPNSDEILAESKGIGIDLALVLFPILHFNRDKTSKQLISFLGLSPRVYESGSSVRKSHKINKIGSSNIRRVLFLNALSCSRFNPILKTKYENLINNGKCKKVALVAVMCAIIRYLKIYFKNEKSIN